jgi:hypothetical protein
MRLPGYKSMELLRRQTDDGEMEFVWVINFDTAETSVHCGPKTTIRFQCPARLRIC